MAQHSFEDLLDGYINDSLSEKELVRFFQLLRQNPDTAALESYIETLLVTPPDSKGLSQQRADEIFNSIVTRIEGPAITQEVDAPARNVRLHQIVVKLALAASAIGVVWLSSFFLFNSAATKTRTAKKTTAAPVVTSLPAAGKKALLTLADGTVVQLQDANNGAVANQGNAIVIKSNGSLQYSINGAAGKDVVYNTISTASGGQYQVQLQDGSRVWLNSNSSLRFPTAFAGKVREVVLTGEAYFEISKNAGRPFVVKADGAEVRVLGTRFNVMAYRNEAAMETTLIEGSVEFVHQQLAKILQPRQQSQLSKDGLVRIIDGVAISKVLAWKEGKFDFDGVDIRSVGRQLERRYDVSVVYRETVRDIFYADIPLATNLPEVLKILELTGKVHFKTEGKIVTVDN